MLSWISKRCHGFLRKSVVDYMEMLHIVFLALVLTECYYSTEAMGICEFAREFPSEDNETSSFFKNPAKCEDNILSDKVTNATSIHCPANMVYANCSSCQGTCEDPYGCINNNCTEPKTCVCINGFFLKGGDCVPEDECTCFLPGLGVLPEGEQYSSEHCSEQCVCDDGLLSCNRTCDNHAECTAKNGVRKCYCSRGYEGDGKTCTVIPKDCYEAYLAGHIQNGVYTILPQGWPESPFDVSCDMMNGGWTRFQRRLYNDSAIDFYRNWQSYKDGFGSVQPSKSFWLGNEKIHYLTRQKTYKLQVDIVTSNRVSKRTTYNSFRIGNEGSNYRLNFSTSSVTGPNGLKGSNGKAFSTYDNDHDGCKHNCAMRHRGGWWFNVAYCNKCLPDTFCSRFYVTANCTNTCTRGNLNGQYSGGNGKNIFWKFYENCNLRSTEMKVRPASA